MAYAAAKTIDVSEIPVIDIGPLTSGDAHGAAAVVAALHHAATTIGFLYVRNHGIPEATIEAAQAAARAFFALPLETKQRVAVSRHHRGFIRVGESTMYEGARVDLKESFLWGRELAAGDPELATGNRLVGPNQWPDFMPALKTAVYPYFEAAVALGRTLLGAFALGLGKPASLFAGAFGRHVSRGSVIYYPPQPPGLGTEQFGVAPHTDFGCLTVLWQDQVGGLQVLNRAGEWVTAHPIPGTLVVNVADLLSRWSNDRLISTMHRVINTAPGARYSMAMAIDPNFETVVDPAAVCAPGETPKYPPVTVGDYVLGRFDKAFAYRK